MATEAAPAATASFFADIGAEEEQLAHRAARDAADAAARLVPVGRQRRLAHESLAARLALQAPAARMAHGLDHLGGRHTRAVRAPDGPSARKSNAAKMRADAAEQRRLADGSAAVRGQARQSFASALREASGAAKGARTAVASRNRTASQRDKAARGALLEARAGAEAAAAEERRLLAVAAKARHEELMELHAATREAEAHALGEERASATEARQAREAWLDGQERLAFRAAEDSLSASQRPRSLLDPGSVRAPGAPAFFFPSSASEASSMAPSTLDRSAMAERLMYKGHVRSPQQKPPPGARPRSRGSVPLPMYYVGAPDRAVLMRHDPARDEMIRRQHEIAQRRAVSPGPRCRRDTSGAAYVEGRREEEAIKPLPPGVLMTMRWDRD